jgi:hypothetical protein
VETLRYQNFRCMITGFVHCMRRNESFCRRSCLVFQGRISFCGKSAAGGAVAGFGCCLEELIRRESCTTEEEKFGVVV